MKTAGIIAEYNPFHNGHLYQLQKTREMTGADFVIIVMSGDFMQRGTPALFDKYLRCRAALLGGADLVIEMPVFGSLSSAADFADCGVFTADHPSDDRNRLYLLVNSAGTRLYVVEFFL